MGKSNHSNSKKKGLFISELFVFMSCDTDQSPNFYVFGDLKCQKSIFGEILGKQEDAMRPKNFKGGRCIKTKLKKCDEVARTYDKIQTAYGKVHL